MMHSGRAVMVRPGNDESLNPLQYTDILLIGFRQKVLVRGTCHGDFNESLTTPGPSTLVCPPYA